MMAEAIGFRLGGWLPGLQLRKAYSWAEARALLQNTSTPPEFIVTDLQLPDSPPEQTLRSLREWQAQVPVLALTMLTDQATQELCARHQALYLCKSAAFSQLLQSLQKWLGADFWQKWRAQAPLQHNPLHDLTTRQLDTLRELANGRSNREIADRLCVSEDTVRSHMKSLFVRLAVKNRTQASKFYLQHIEGLHPPGA
jgi:DNA-binding NarL/FixJ family response regulator